MFYGTFNPGVPLCSLQPLNFGKSGFFNAFTHKKSHAADVDIFQMIFVAFFIFPMKTFSHINLGSL